VPAEVAGVFHHQALSAGGGQHAFAVGGVLFFEQLHAGHRHKPHVFAFGTQFCGLFGAELQLEAGANQDQIGGAVAVFEDVTALGYLIGAGVRLVGRRLTAEEQHAGAVSVLDSHLVGTAGLVAVAGADHQHVGD